MSCVLVLPVIPQPLGNVHAAMHEMFGKRSAKVDGTQSRKNAHALDAVDAAELIDVRASARDDSRLLNKFRVLTSVYPILQEVSWVVVGSCTIRRQRNIFAAS